MKDFIKRVLKYIIKGVQPKQIVIERYPAGCLLKGKKILVTGGSKGIGYAIAKLCIEEGAYVLICGRNEIDLINASRSLGERCKYISFDISNTANISSFLLKSWELLGEIDCLVNNAGISFHENNFRDVTQDGFEKQFKVNLEGSYFMAKEFLEFVEVKGVLPKKNILFLTSERGEFYTDIPYGLTKAMLNSLVGGLNNRVAKFGVRINAIAPGVTATPMTGREGADDMTYSGSPSGRVLMPEEIASVAVFLMSDRSSCISGEIINCDYGSHQKCY